MIVELWANMLIEGKKTFNDVPRLLKPRVKAYLTSKGRVDLTLQKTPLHK